MLLQNDTFNVMYIVQCCYSYARRFITERSITTDKVDLEFVSCPIIYTNKKLVFYTYVQYMCIYSISMYTRNKS